MAWAPDYITDAELKAYARVEDAVDDAEIADAIAAASRALDRHCGRQFGKVDSVEERFYTAQWDRRLRRWIIPIDDLMTTTGLVVKNAGTTDEITAYRLEPRNNVVKGKPWELLTVGTDSAVTPCTDEYGISVIASPGWTAVPRPVKFGTKLQANRFLARRDSPFGVAGSPDTGSELRLLAKLDADLKPALADYVRTWAVASSGNQERTTTWPL